MVPISPLTYRGYTPSPATASRLPQALPDSFQLTFGGPQSSDSGPRQTSEPDALYDPEDDSADYALDREPELPDGFSEINDDDQDDADDAITSTDQHALSIDDEEDYADEDDLSSDDNGFNDPDGLTSAADEAMYAEGDFDELDDDDDLDEDPTDEELRIADKRIKAFLIEQDLEDL